MPKSIAVDPATFRQPGKLAFPDIPLHAYARPLAEERKARGDKALADVLRHMMLVREFESMLGSFKARGSYQGMAYTYKGPAHLSIGQEGAAVGAALALSPGDHIFGSHRSHGEIIAKGLRAVQDLAGKDLRGIMESYFGGSILGVVEKHDADFSPLSLGGSDEGAPGDRGGGFYGAYFRDLDGNKLNVYHHEA